ncbi:MAG TPA: hypothetical protein VF184_03250, partial [Phycisphaeraceae bacterium]
MEAIRRHRQWAGVFLLALAAVAPLAIRSQGALAIEMHEIFVARTAEEMLEQGNWLVPLYNGNPRLTKPPLNYWLVMAVDRLGNRDGRISSAEARLPNQVASVIWVGLTALLGAAVAGRSIGLLAGLMLAGMAGYMGYGSNARPDMLYAVLNTGGLLGFVLAYRWHQQQAPRHRTAMAKWAAWISLTLASLTKGPYLPLLIAATFIVWLAARGQRRAIGPVVGPLLGVPVLLAGFLWWYLLIFQRTPHLLEVLQTEVNQRIQQRHKSWLDWIKPYYLPATAQMVMPWLLFFGLAILAPLSRRFRANPLAMLVWWACLVSVLAFQVLWERYRHYTLPVLGPLAVLMAMQAVAMGRWLIERDRAWLWRLVVAGHLAGFVVLLAGVRWLVPDEVAPPAQAVVALGIGSLAAIIALEAFRSARGDRVELPLAVTAVASVALCALLGFNASIWNPQRIRQRDAAYAVGDFIETATKPVVSWQYGAHYVRYYLHRNILTVHDPAKLAALAAQHAGLYVLTEARKPIPPTLP